MQFIYYGDSNYDMSVKAIMTPYAIVSKQKSSTEMGIFMEWVKQIFVTGIMTEIILHLLPDKKYDKYVRLICGVILTMVCISPILSFFNNKNNIKDYIHIFEKIGQKYDSQTMIENMQGTDQSYYIQNYIKENSKYINGLVLEAGLNPIDCQIILDMEEDSQTYGSIKTIVLTVTDGKNSCYEKGSGYNDSQIPSIYGQDSTKKYSDVLLTLVETISVTYEISKQSIQVKVT